MEEIKKENDGRGNIILLTVIAIVTMVVVVIGATFAYLASSVSDGDEANINATTNAGSDFFLLNAGDDVEIIADLDNFYEGAGDLKDEMSASVQLSTTNTEGVSYDYRVYLNVPHNDFEYSSGTCYQVPETTNIVASTKEECLENSSTNIWATTDGEGFKCYGPSEPVVGVNYSNELQCLSVPGHMWQSTDDAELVIDLYQAINNVGSADACANDGGVCVNSKREILSDKTTQQDCVSESAYNTWLPNIWAPTEELCYKVIAAADVTEYQTEGTEFYTLLDKATISATNGTTRHHYRGVVTLINFGHNQIVNGNKSFNGILNFERIIPEVIE